MKKDILFLTVGRVFAAVAFTVSLILLARWSSAEEFGQVSALLGVGYFIVAFLDLGLSTFILRTHAMKPGSGEVGDALRISTITVPFSVFFITLVGIVLQFQLGTAILLALGMSLDKFSDNWQNVLVAERRNSRATALLIQRRLIAFVGFVVLNYLQVDPVLAFAFMIAIAGLFNQIFRRASLRNARGRTSRSLSKTLLVTRSYWVAVVSAQSRELDTVVALSVMGPALAGAYAAGMRLTRPVLLLAGTVANVLLPHLSTSGPTHARKATRAVICFALMSMVAGLACFPFVPMVVQSVLGGGYPEAGAVSAIILVAIGPMAACSILGSILQSQDYARYVAVNGLLTALLILAGVGVGGALDGAIGAAIGISCAFVIKFVSLSAYALSKS